MAENQSKPPAKVRVVINQNVNAEDGFKIYSDGEDITDKLYVKSLSCKVDGKTGYTKVMIETYVDKVEIEGDLEIQEVEDGA